MAKKNKQNIHYKKANSEREQESKLGTLKDLLNQDVLNKLKAQSQELENQAKVKKEQEAKKREEERKAEQKRLDNDFEYLLNNSSLDWKKHK